MVGTIKKPSGMLMYLAGETPLSKVDGWKAKGIDIQDKLEGFAAKQYGQWRQNNGDQITH